MQIFRRLTDAASRIARQSLSANSARGVHVSAIEVAVPLSFLDEAGSGAGVTGNATPPMSGLHELAITYHLTSHQAPDGRPLLFDCLPTPGPIQFVESSVADVRVTHLRGAVSRASVLELTLRPGRTWDGSTLRFGVRWNVAGAGSPAAFVVPDFLPQVLSDVVSEIPQPEIRISPLDAGFESGYLRWDDARGGLVQTVLVPFHLLHAGMSDDTRIMLDRSTFGHLRLGEVRRVERLTDNILGFLTGFFGCAPDVRIFATSLQALSGTIHEPAGAVLTANPQWFGTHGGEPADVQLAMRLAGIWWGGGIRVVGRHSREFESAVRAVAGLAWARYIGEDEAYAIALRSLRTRLRSRTIAILNKSKVSTVTGGMVVRLVERGAADPDSTLLRELTSSRCGYLVPSELFAGW